MIETIDIFRLTVKYWFQGDSWADAKETAKVMVKGFKK